VLIKRHVEYLVSRNGA